MAAADVVLAGFENTPVIPAIVAHPLNILTTKTQRAQRAQSFCPSFYSCLVIESFFVLLSFRAFVMFFLLRVAGYGLRVAASYQFFGL